MKDEDVGEVLGDGFWDIKYGYAQQVIRICPKRSVTIAAAVPSQNIEDLPNEYPTVGPVHCSPPPVSRQNPNVPKRSVPAYCPDEKLA